MLPRDALPANRAALLILLPHPHHLKVVAREVHNIAPAVRQPQGEPVLVVPELVVVLKVEHALLALPALPLARIPLEHSVLKAHGGVVLAEPPVAEGAPVVAKVVLVQKRLTALLQPRRASGRRPARHALEVAPADVVLCPRLALVELVEPGADLVELGHLLGPVDVLRAAFLPARLLGLFGLALAVEPARGERSLELRELGGGHGGVCDVTARA